jgi:hypothetical protein
MDAETFFIQRTIAYARSLPIPDAVQFLRGACHSLKGGEGLEELRSITTRLSESDNQLELIQTGQLKLALN